MIGIGDNEVICCMEKGGKVTFLRKYHGRVVKIQFLLTTKYNEKLLSCDI